MTTILGDRFTLGPLCPLRLSLVSVDTAAVDWRTRYDGYVADLRRQLAALPGDKPLRLAKKTSNLFRPRADSPVDRLDVTAFDGVLHVDPQTQTAEVLGMTTYEHLVQATLPYGLMPMCVPQLKTITLGGAVTGLGIESGSFRLGLPHESVIEMDILTGDGEVLTVSPAEDDPHRDLFFGFANSYGSLGYALRLKIELEPTKPFVHLRHLRFDTAEEMTRALTEISASHEYDGRRVDFLDGTVFSPSEQYLTLGEMVGRLPDGLSLSDYTGMDIYYRSIQSKAEDVLTIHDYLWRWDTDWFWCSRAFGTQKPASVSGGRSPNCAATSTGNSSRWIASSRSRHEPMRFVSVRPASRWCKTSRFPRIAYRSSWTSSTRKWGSNPSGCVHLSNAIQAPVGRCTNSMPRRCT
jgi:FAD/FMN-containing dehydrogenase